MWVRGSGLRCDGYSIWGVPTAWRVVWQRAPFLALCSPFDTFVGPLPTVLSAGLVRGDDSFDGYSFECELLFLFATVLALN